NRGIMLECWRHLGHLYFGPIASDWEKYTENPSYAQRVRDKAAHSKGSERNHPVAASMVAKRKAGEQSPTLAGNHR
ncbi:MAG: hypothetical protein J2P56_01185, partial [Verrucomicrobia bacterium]|nr:hypothetical protein [Verrucomicrobiota bacterium]